MKRRHTALVFKQNEYLSQYDMRLYYTKGFNGNSKINRASKCSLISPYSRGLIDVRAQLRRAGWIASSTALMFPCLASSRRVSQPPSSLNPIDIIWWRDLATLGSVGGNDTVFCGGT